VSRYPKIDLDGAVVAVTGAARGIGLATAKAFVAGKLPIKGLAVYNASKFAVVGLTAATRLEYDGTGVSISAVLPAVVRTELSSGIDYAGMPAVEPEASGAPTSTGSRTRSSGQDAFCSPRAIVGRPASARARGTSMPVRP
jgi:NAD(P)-dependent dehydrogenase (short-subunit alcohol dehydrogenase family)